MTSYPISYMKKISTIAAALLTALICTTRADAKDLNVRIIQPPYAPDAAGAPASFEWLMDQLGRCTPDLDIILLPEFSDVPGRTRTREEYMAAVDANNARLLKACQETAVRCSSIVFVNAIDHVAEGIRNTTFAFDRSGGLAGRYYKRHVTAGERDDLGFDVSYARRWSEPDILELEGIRFAFETCYDFYFYEMIGPIALQQPDIVVGCSLQRSDKHHALEFINQFCAYNTGAYLIRASVSMGLDSTVGGSSMVVAPDGIILGNMRSQVGTLDVTIDPEKKYLKPAGFGNPPATHPSYMEIGRRPWLYRPGGSAICLPMAEAAPQRICARGGLRRLSRKNPLAAIGAAVAMDADEIGLRLTVAADGTIMHRDCSFETILRKFSCHTIMGLSLEGKGWDGQVLKELVHLIKAYDAWNYVYVISDDASLLAAAAEAEPRIQRCFKGSVKAAGEASCRMVMLPEADVKAAEEAHAAGLRCIAQGRRRIAGRLFGMGIDTVIIDDFR